MKTEIVKIENGIIECPVIDGQRYIAIKPVKHIILFLELYSTRNALYFF